MDIPLPLEEPLNVREAARPLELDVAQAIAAAHNLSLLDARRHTRNAKEGGRSVLGQLTHTVACVPLAELDWLIVEDDLHIHKRSRCERGEGKEGRGRATGK